MNINKATPGMELGYDIIDDEGRMLLRKKTILTDKIIMALQKKEVQYLYIDDPMTKSVVIDEVIPPSLKNSTIKYLKKMNMEQTITNAKGIVDNILSMQNLSVDIYSNSTGEDSLFEHSLAVTQLAVLFGNSLSYSQADLNELAISSLLHDIGKLCALNPEILSKYDFKATFNSFGIELPTFYDDRYHPLYGYAMLKDNAMLNSVTRNSILRHHERIDDSGIKYVRKDGLDNGKATQFAKIINISDTFVRLMTNTYSEAKVSSVTEAIEYMKAYEGIKFDKEYTDKFLESVPILPKGLTVELSNGMQAVIYDSNKETPTRPKIILDNGGKIVDLTDPRLQSLLITSICGDNMGSVEKQL